MYLQSITASHTFKALHLFCFHFSLGLERNILFGLKEHDAVCSNRLTIFFVDIVFHWLVIIGPAAKIVTDKGRALYEMFFAPSIQIPEELEMNVVRVSTIPVENHGSSNHGPYMVMD